MCDKKKRFLWAYPSNKGATHDSAAFAGSKLYDLLKETSRELSERGLFIVGDTAYSLTPFMLTPYDQSEVEKDVTGALDGFNYHLSSCRIYIECAFGELVMRWGILWRTLLFDLRKSEEVITTCMLLHNFIVECRDVDESTYFRDFHIDMDGLQRKITKKTGEIPRPVVTDNNEPRGRGRPSMDELEMKRVGEEIRHRLTVKLASQDMKRPMQHDMHYNSFGHIFINSS
jgi:DDE superfamily endonuclease